MANETWSQKPLITEISNTTEFCILDEAIPKNKRINAKALLDAKANSSTLSSHTSNTDNPHSVTKTQVGLGNVDNTSDLNKPISTAQQTALDLKAPLHNPDFTGAAWFKDIYSTGAINSEDTIYAEQQITANRVMADEQMIFGPDAVIKITTGYNGSTPVYREFPATELASSDLNGTQYVMVYGVGTPEENAAELQAAYDEAKNMPRYLGTVSTPIYMYIGQTYCVYAGSYKYYKVVVDRTYNPYGSTANYIEISESEAKSTRTTIIVAPGEYNFGDSAFVVDATGINIVSLTGNSDVIIRSTEVNSNPNYTYGIKVTANNILIKGIDCKTNAFYIVSNLNNLICEYCKGGNYSFGYGITVSGIFNHCIGGDKSFGCEFGGTASGTFNYCTGGGSSFGITSSGTFNYCTGGYNSFGSYGGTASGTFNNCIGGEYSFGGIIEASARLYYTRLTSGTFPTPVAGGRLILCIDGGNNVVTI